MKFLKDEMLRDGTKLWWKIRDVEHKHMVNITAILSKYNLYPTQPRILGVILRMDGATQKEIAEEIQTSPSALAMSIKRLQKAQLIEKTFDEKDLRTNKIVVTPKGKKIHDESLDEIIKEDCRMLENFTPEEVSKLMSFLDRIYDNIGKDS